MDELTKVKYVLKMCGLPARYAEETYATTLLTKDKTATLRDSIFKIPQSARLLVSGSAGPIVNQLINEMNKKVVGCSFTEYFESKLSNEPISLPKASVVVIYSVGAEPARNKEFSTTILNSIIEFYRNNDTLLIFETPLTLTQFETTYGISIPNKRQIKIKPSSDWVLAT